MLALAIVAAVLGLIVLVMGLRGRRVDAHPVCRKCRFDLEGLARGECPECGADVRADGAVRVGNRRKRRGAIVLGVVLLALGLGGSGVLAWGSATKFNWNTIKPVWMLTRELKSRDVATVDAAATELLARAEKEKLRASEWAPVVATALDVQGNTSGPWAKSVGNLLLQARRAGALDEAGLSRYIRQGVQLSLEARPRVAMDGEAAARMHVRPLRTGEQEWLKLRMAMVKTTMDGNVVVEREDRWGSSMNIAPVGTSSSSIPTPVAGLAPGKHEVRQEWSLWVTESHGHDEGRMVPWKQEFVAAFELLGPGESTVTMTKDEALQEVMEKKVRLSQLRIEDGKHVSGAIDMQQLPMAVGFDVIFRTRDENGVVREEVLAQVNAPAGAWHGHGIGGDLKTPIRGDKVDVVLRASRAAAEKTVDLTEIWDGSIEFKDVAIAAPEK